MSTLEATGIVYRFQVNHGCNSSVCHPCRGMVGRLLPKVCCELRGVLGLDLLEATVGSQSPICASRGHSSWEPGLQHRGNSPFLPLTTPSLLLHPGFPVTPVMPTGAALGRHFEKELVRLKLWHGIIEKTPWERLQQEKELDEPRKTTRPFF